LLTEDGQIARFVNVYVNDEDVRFMQGLVTPVKESDTVVILPAMSGGK
jgi:molybdopterin converting factor small subunit